MLGSLLFPYENIRKTQDDLIISVDEAIKNKANLLAHAPTGIGKTAASLAPALAHVLDKKLTLFFLTSRHTQHKIALETLKTIKKKFNKDFVSVDFIGKKWMCAVDHVDKMPSSGFAEYCKAQREEKKCDFYTKTYDEAKLSVKAQKVLAELKKSSPNEVEDVIAVCKKEKLCPYEISYMLARDADVIVTDYYYVYDPKIRNAFFKKTKKELGKSVVIVDEAHNLGKRIRDLMTVRLTSGSLKNAIKEAKKYNKNIVSKIVNLQDVLVELSANMRNKQEKIVTKSQFLDAVNKFDDYESLVTDLNLVAEDVRRDKKRSFIGGVAHFLELWPEQDEGFTRIVSMGEYNGEPSVVLSYKCLDPGIFTKEVINETYSTIAMSGTLTPTNMYKDTLGFENSVEKTYPNPFPKENKLSLILPKTTTKYSQRSEQQFKRIAMILSEINDRLDGNLAFFFPSYKLRDQVYNYFSEMSSKKIILEEPNSNKKDREKILNEFKRSRLTGAVLMSVINGSFSEGVDLPGDLLKGVVVVGLPLEPPDLETKEMIDYYEKKFAKGWDYAYILPAFIKSLQAAGRCIRSETDKGVIIYLDERYAWERYLKCFPPDANVKISRNFEEELNEFFSKDIKRDNL